MPSIIPVIHIAYAEDHTAVRKGIIALLNTLGGIVIDIEAEHGEELIRKLEKANMLPAICIIDINMPQMDGFETLKVIKERWPEIKTLVLTVYDEELHRIRMIRNGANGYLLKNCHPEEIKKALQSIAAKNYYYSDVANSKYFHEILSKKIKLPNFSAKEIEVLKYSCTDLSYAQIGEKMSITQRSAEGYRDSLFRKLDIHSRSSLVLCAIKYGFVSIDTSPMLKLLK
jgi:two-component system invasion response regulator UvrY